MNYLAHFLLSGPNHNVILGNFIGDSIKGSNFNNYSHEIALGIKLHRLIDFTTDTHPLVKKHNALIAPVFGKYSGIVTDVYYDFILATNWEKYHTESLKQYSEKMVTILTKRQEELPHKAMRFLGYMIKNDIPHMYHQITTIEQVYKGLAYRIGNESPLHLAPEAVLEFHTLFEKDFETLWTDLKLKTSDFLSNANI